MQITRLEAVAAAAAYGEKWTRWPSNYTLAHLSSPTGLPVPVLFERVAVVASAAAAAAAAIKCFLMQTHIISVLFFSRVSSVQAKESHLAKRTKPKTEKKEKNPRLGRRVLVHLQVNRRQRQAEAGKAATKESSLQNLRLYFKVENFLGQAVSSSSSSSR